MAKKDEKSQSKKKEPSKASSKANPKTPPEEPKTEKKKPKYEFDLSDGFTYHDVIGFFIIIGRIILYLLMIVFYPYYWVLNRFWLYIKFMKSADSDNALNEDEKYFVESIPILYLIAGLLGGILIGVLAVIQFKTYYEAFITQFKIDAVWKNISLFFKYIGLGIYYFFYYIYIGLAYVVNFFIALYSSNVMIALAITSLIGLLFIVIIVLFGENSFLSRLLSNFLHWIAWILTSPELVKERITISSRKINRRVSYILIGKERLYRRKKTFFKKVLSYTFLYGIWVFGAGIIIGINFKQDLQGGYLVAYFGGVLLLFGFLTGFIVLTFIVALLDRLSRKKYILDIPIEEIEKLP